MNPQNNPLPEKPTFYNLCMHYKVNNQVLEALSALSHIPKSVIDAMFLDTAVERADAEKVLATFSNMTTHDWDLKNTNIPIIESPIGGAE